MSGQARRAAFASRAAAPDPVRALQSTLAAEHADVPWTLTAPW